MHEEVPPFEEDITLRHKAHLLRERSARHGAHCLHVRHADDIGKAQEGSVCDTTLAVNLEIVLRSFIIAGCSSELL